MYMPRNKMNDKNTTLSCIEPNQSNKFVNNQEQPNIPSNLITKKMQGVYDILPKTKEDLLGSLEGFDLISKIVYDSLCTSS